MDTSWKIEDYLLYDSLALCRRAISSRNEVGSLHTYIYGICEIFLLCISDERHIMREERAFQAAGSKH